MLVKCAECGHEVSSKAPSCPNCGYYPTERHKCHNCKHTWYRGDDDICGYFGYLRPTEDEFLCIGYEYDDRDTD